MNTLMKFLGTLTGAIAFSASISFAGIPADYEDIEKPPLMKRYPKTIADPSGKVNIDTTYIADHLAIRNLISSYGHHLDDDHFDMFMDIFVKNKPVLQVSAPCWANFEITGFSEIREFVNTRFDGRIYFVQGRHTQAMIHVSSQTSDAATVRSQALLGSTPNDGKSGSSLGRASYNFWLVKQKDQWKVSKLYIELDSPLKAHELPKTTHYEKDDRELCKK